MSSIGENNISLAAGRLKEERKRLGMSQQSAAETCDVSREMWGKYERGQGVPGGEVLFAFAAAGADVQYILTGVRSGSIVVEKAVDQSLECATGPQGAPYQAPGRVTRHGIAEQREITPRQQAFLALLDALDDTQQSEVFQLAEEKKRLKELEEEVRELKKKAK